MPCLLLPLEEEPSFSQGLPKGREEAQTCATDTCLQPQAVREERTGQGSCGQVVGWKRGHAKLGAALAQDRELGAPVHPAAGQRWVTMLEVHGEVSVHLPAPPFPLDLCLHL